MYEYQRRIAAEAAKFQNTAESIELTEGTEVRVGKFVFETQKDGWAIHGSIRGIGYIAPTGAGTPHTGIIYGVWLSRGNMEKDKLVITFKYDHPLGSTDPKGKLLQGVAKWLESRHPELLEQVEDVVAEGKKKPKDKPAFPKGAAVTVSFMGKTLNGVVVRFVRAENDADAESYIIKTENGKTIRYPWDKVKLKK